MFATFKSNNEQRLLTQGAVIHRIFSITRDW